MKKWNIIFGCLLLMIIMTGCGKKESQIATLSNNSSNVYTELNVEDNDIDTESTTFEAILTETQTETEAGNSKIAVVYFSGTGNTKAVAEMIAKEAGGDLFEIIPKQAYSKEDLNYNNDDCRANKEQNDESARPEISNELSATQEYDVIFLGHPIWWGTVPRIIQTYLEQYDISGASIYTFCTSGGSGIEKSISDLREWYPELNIIDGKRLNEATDSDIEEFLKETIIY